MLNAFRQRFIKQFSTTRMDAPAKSGSTKETRIS